MFSPDANSMPQELNLPRNVQVQYCTTYPLHVSLTKRYSPNCGSTEREIIDTVKTRKCCGLIEGWNPIYLFLNITGAFFHSKGLEDFSSYGSRNFCLTSAITAKLRITRLNNITTKLLHHSTLVSSRIHIPHLPQCGSEPRSRKQDQGGYMLIQIRLDPDQNLPSK